MKADHRSPTGFATHEHRLTLTELMPLLIEDGLVSVEQAPQVDGERLRKLPVHPLVWLVQRDLRRPDDVPLDLVTLTQWLAARVGLPYFAIDPLKLDVDAVTSEVSRTYTARYAILPVAVDDHSVTFATAEPFERRWELEMSHVLKRDVRRVIALPPDIARYQDELFGVSQSIRKAGRVAAGDPLGINNLEALVQLGRSGQLDANDRHVVTIVDWLLQYAFDQRASDIHLEPRRENGTVRFRIDGVLHNVYQIPTTILGAVTSRIKALGRMDVVEKRRPQDGRVKSKTPQGNEIELRLSTMPTAFGEKLVMRIFDPKVLVRDTMQLGFGERDARLWLEMTAASHGIILVTGPTGSGKTTTLYSTLKQLAQPDVNVCTVEDPIEMVEPALNQMQVNSQIGLDFAAGVRTLMRQDPDIIMVGEIRDLETAEMAIQAALTGHLVLSTLHTNDAPSAVVRLMDIGVPPYLINATLLGVVGQRLVRTLCPECRAENPTDADAWHDLVEPRNLPVPARNWAPVGCDHCRGSGYFGRIGIYESLRVTAGLRQTIRADCSIADVRRQAMHDGMDPLRISGARKVITGITSLAEVLRVAPLIELG